MAEHGSARNGNRGIARRPDPPGGRAASAASDQTRPDHRWSSSERQRAIRRDPGEVSTGSTTGTGPQLVEVSTGPTTEPQVVEQRAQRAIRRDPGDVSTGSTTGTRPQVVEQRAQ